MPSVQRVVVRTNETLSQEKQIQFTVKWQREKRKVEKAKSSGKNAPGSSKNALEKSNTQRAAAPNKVIELGIFVDQAALGLFMPYVGDKQYEKLREMVLAFVIAVSWFTRHFWQNCKWK